MRAGLGAVITGPHWPSPSDQARSGASRFLEGRARSHAVRGAPRGCSGPFPPRSPWARWNRCAPTAAPAASSYQRLPSALEPGWFRRCSANFDPFSLGVWSRALSRLPPSSRARRSWRPEGMGFAALRFAQRAAHICFMRPFNLIVELQASFCHQWQAVRPDESVCQVCEMRARGSPFLRFPEEAHSAQRTAESRDAAHRGSAPSEGPVGAISVRLACSSIE